MKRHVEILIQVTGETVLKNLISTDFVFVACPLTGYIVLCTIRGQPSH
jgi:hypothetical protein